MSPERREAIRYSAWLNLFIGFYNMYLWNVGGTWFNFLVGSINIWVWVAMRHIALRKFKQNYKKRNRNEND